jgi:cytoskeletal protein CcmA (bactofilin family)
MLNNLEKPNFEMSGIYRGLVENNADPTDSGLIQVRIMGIHESDGNIVPISQLPWAKPAIGLYWSGGYNIRNADHQNETPDKPSARYNPGNNSLVAGTRYTADNFPIDAKTKFVEEKEDPYANACGTGGHFVVPKRGNWVFLFFEGGNHLQPVYFAMCPMARDWATQKAQRNKELTEKIAQITDFRKEFEPRTQAEAEADSWAGSAVVNSLVDVPKLEIPQIDQSDSNRDISCTTSAHGTTIIVDNRYKKERIYVIHKNSLDHIDEHGNKKVYIGRARNKVDPGSNDPDTPANYEIGVEGDHELFILGDYKMYTKGNVFIQNDGNMQMDISKNVGIVSREGDVDIIVQNGNINVDTKGNANINVEKNANIKVTENVNLMVKKDLKATVEGTSDLLLKGTVKLQTEGDLDATINGSLKINALNSVDVTSPEVRFSGNVSVQGALKVTQDLDVSGSVKVQQVVYALAGMDCGGYIRNRGPADLGFPLTAHGLIVTGGNGSGSGRTASRGANPSTPTTPSEATPSNGIDVNKDDLKDKTTENEE